MAISQAFCTSAKVDFFTGTITPLSDTIKMALYVSSATLGASTTAYTSSNEVTGTGYTAGGATLSGAAINSSGTTAWLTFSNVSWPSSSITARGAMIYDASKSNKAIAVLDFGADKTSSDSTFTVQIPTADATSALIRIA